MSSHSEEVQELIDKLLSNLEVVKSRLKAMFEKELKKKTIAIRPIGVGLSHKLEIENISNKSSWLTKALGQINRELKLPVRVSHGREKSIIISIDESHIKLCSSIILKSSLPASTTPSAPPVVKKESIISYTSRPEKVLPQKLVGLLPSRAVSGKRK